MNANKQDAGGLPNELGFEQWYVTNTFDYPSNPLGSRDCSIARKAWHAALEAVRNGEQCRAASGEAEELALTLERMADNAYCDYIRKMQRDECLGWEEKVRRGSFDSDNLRAHVGAGELLGRHRALHEAAKLLRALSRGVPEGETPKRGEATGDTTTFSDAWARLSPIDRAVITTYFERHFSPAIAAQRKEG